jgi:hypothetical protein
VIGRVRGEHGSGMESHLGLDVNRDSGHFVEGL